MKTMIVNNIGYTQSVFESLGANRAYPRWLSAAPGSNKATISMPEMSQPDLDAALARDKNGELRRVLSECFMCSVSETEVYKYKITTAIGELHLGTILNLSSQFAGI